MTLINQLNNLNYISWRLEFIENFRGVVQILPDLLVFRLRFQQTNKSRSPISQSQVSLPGFGKVWWEDITAIKATWKSASQPLGIKSRRVTSREPSALLCLQLDTQPQGTLLRLSSQAGLYDLLRAFIKLKLRRLAYHHIPGSLEKTEFSSPEFEQLLGWTGLWTSHTCLFFEYLSSNKRKKKPNKTFTVSVQMPKY